MERHRLYQRDFLSDFLDRLKDSIKCILGTVIFLGLALLALILLSAIYIPKLDS